MRAVFGGSLVGARKIDGQNLRQVPNSELPERKQSTSADRNVQPISFRDLAVMAYPNKTEANLAFLGRVDVRTARRWLADDSEPPAEILGIVLAEIMRRFHQRP